MNKRDKRSILKSKVTINDLPADILSFIFKIGFNENIQSWMTLLSVNKHWRKLSKIIFLENKNYTKDYSHNWIYLLLLKDKIINELTIEIMTEISTFKLPEYRQLSIRRHSEIPYKETYILQIGNFDASKLFIDYQYSLFRFLLNNNITHWNPNKWEIDNITLLKLYSHKYSTYKCSTKKEFFTKVNMGEKVITNYDILFNLNIVDVNAWYQTELFLLLAKTLLMKIDNEVIMIFNKNSKDIFTIMNEASLKALMIQYYISTLDLQFNKISDFIKIFQVLSKNPNIKIYFSIDKLRIIDSKKEICIDYVSSFYKSIPGLFLQNF